METTVAETYAKVSRFHSGLIDKRSIDIGVTEKKTALLILMPDGYFISLVLS